MHHHRGHRRQQLDQIISVRNRIHTVQRRTVKSKQLCRVFPVQGISRSRQGTCAQRTVVHPLMDIFHPGAVSPEHLEICSHMVRQRDRLCFLEMGKSRHICLCVLLHQFQEHFQHLPEQSVELADLIPCIQLHIQRDLIIPAAPGVQLLSRIPDAFDQIRLHKTVDVFIFVCDLQASVLHISADPLQPFYDLRLLLLRQDPLLREHRHMRDAAPDILLIKSLVERNRSIKIVHQLIRLFCETSAP